MNHQRDFAWGFWASSVSYNGLLRNLSQTILCFNSNQYSSASHLPSVCDLLLRSHTNDLFLSQQWYCISVLEHESVQVVTSVQVWHDKWFSLGTRGAPNGWHRIKEEKQTEGLTSTKRWWEVPLCSTARWYNTREDAVSLQYKPWLTAVSDLVPHVVPRAMNDSIWNEARGATRMAGQDWNTEEQANCFLISHI